MKTVALIAAVMLVGLAPRVLVAQWISVSDEQPRPLAAGLPESVSRRAPNVVEEWEDALARDVSDAETWSAIGQRLYRAGRYRESIAALERSLVQRGERSKADARYIADAYAKLGNVKQASRWRAWAGAAVDSSRRHARITV